jgi:4-hydroxybenzoate polyprenyltransferase
METALAQTLPLCVDLDGTLIPTDVLSESLVVFLKRAPWRICSVMAWLWRGKAYLKQQIAARVQLDIESLPYNQRFLSFLQDEHNRGRKLVLATAADARIAQQIANYLGIFDMVVASDGTENLRGEQKMAKLCSIFGEKGFVYAGNDASDLAVWKHAAGAIVINASPEVVKNAGQVCEITQVFLTKKKLLLTWIKALRIHQWAKNLLLFVPLIAAHKLTDPVLCMKAIEIFIAFSLCASSVYILNDLLDLQSDRRHARKKDRPFASGALSLTSGLLCIPLLLCISSVLGYLLHNRCVAILAFYFMTTLLYSCYFKQIVLFDVFCLASFYCIRIWCGAVALDIFVSHWLLAFSLFFFLSLAFVKRFTELQCICEVNKKTMDGRGYVASDMELLLLFGVASGYIAVLIFALYINSEHVKTIYASPERLWLLCPVILYWISYIWLLAHRGQMNEDPVAFALCDKKSYISAFLMAGIMWLAT